MNLTNYSERRNKLKFDHNFFSSFVVSQKEPKQTKQIMALTEREKKKEREKTNFIVTSGLLLLLFGIQTDYFVVVIAKGATPIQIYIHRRSANIFTS